MMNKNIVALFDDIGVARQVIKDLVNAGFPRSSISLVTNDANNQYSRYLDKNYVPRKEAVTATEGASFGAVVGALTGVLVGVTALILPSIGQAIVVGPVVAGVVGAVFGALIGGIVGALVKTSAPEDETPYYAEGIRHGGTLISLRTSQTLRAEDIINRHGSVNIHERIEVWRQAGWKGFGSEPAVTEADTAKSVPVTVPEIPIARETEPITVVPVVQADAPIEGDKAAEAQPVMVVTNRSYTEIPFTPIPALTTVEPDLGLDEKESNPE
jgi:hypothetical protein